MSRRSDRVAEAIKREVSILIKHELRDPRIGFVTITRATITQDLRSAIVYYSVLGDEAKRKLAHKGLQSAVRFIKKEIGDKLGLRYAPDIRLKIDDAMVKAGKIDDILMKIKKEKEDTVSREDKDVN